MKHIFSVHSPITFLAAHTVIDNLNLEIKDVVILTTKYKIPINKYRVVSAYADLKSKWFQKILNLNNPLKEDDYINDVTQNEQFTAYIDLMSYSQATLVTHKKCVGFHFIEEGNSSYRKDDTLDSVTWNWYRKSYSFRIYGFKNRIRNILNAIRWSIRGYSHRLLAMPYSFTSYAFFENTKFFGFSDLAYPNISQERKTLLKLLPSTSDIQELAGNVSLADAVIWVDGSSSSFTGLNEQVYFDAIEKAIAKRKTWLQEKPVFLKLRPGTKKYSDNYLYKALVREGVQVSVLPDNLIIEAIFVNSKNCIVIGNLTSALFYAAIFGHEAYSIYHLYDVRVKTIFDEMPGYWSQVQKI